MLVTRALNELHMRASRRLGAATAELALVSPILVILFLGMTEMSRMMMVKVALSDAARKGCQTGAMPGKTNQDIITDVTNTLRSGGFDTTRFNPPTLGSITITITDPGGNSVADAVTAVPDSMVSVQVMLPVSSSTWVTSYFVSGNTGQWESVVMKKQ